MGGISEILEGYKKITKRECSENERWSYCKRAWIFLIDVMTPDELIRHYDKTIRDLSSAPAGEIMANVGTTGLTLLRERVQKSGTNADGQQFKPYSTKPMLTNCSSMTGSACSSVAGSKEKRRSLQWATVKDHRLFELPGGYKQYRELHGRQTNHVDFTFYGRMWANIALISKGSDHIRGVAIIGAKEETEKKKLSGNTARRGDILDLSTSEIEQLKTLYSIKELQIIRSNGL